MLDRSASPLVNLHPGLQAPYSPLDTESSNWNYMKMASFIDTGASRVNQLMPRVNPLDTQALNSSSNYLCPATKVEGLEDFSHSRIGLPLPNTHEEQANISKDIDYEEPAKIGVLKKPKSKHCSSVAQQAEETMETKKDRPSKAISSRIYRAKVAEAFKALKNALPCSETGNQTSMLDNVIDYIKYLKLRLKVKWQVLSQTRLNGEASAHSFVDIELNNYSALVFLYPFVLPKGFGHYLLHPQACFEPLEEMVGHLLKSNPQVANELLEHKGFAIVPMDSAYAILQTSLNPCSNSCQ
ncbi:Transcription factor bHLH82 [Dendrobium catenatum]|uniref:Transcription factor bHLH82 n=1 Tax=Dendrobium catenatum TaxID=906689 RepID=A0A2I0WFP7_9ASPA|nr:Transcription factor bHLH82 [Dendrobium catenatum]